MASFNRYDYLSSSGNLVVKAGGGNIYTNSPTGPQFTLLDGEFAFINPKTGATLDSGDIATADAVAIVVGYGSVPGGLATEVRWAGGGIGTDLCDGIAGASAEPPIAAQGQVKDFFFDCTKCGGTYTLNVNLDDNFTRSNLPEWQVGSYPFPVVAQCNSACEDCAPEHDCAAMVTQFVNSINGIYDPAKVSRFRRYTRDKQYQPFRAVSLGSPATAHEFKTNFTIANGMISAIRGIEFGATAVTFTNTTVPGDLTKTYPSQLPEIIRQANEFLAANGGGTAYYTENLGSSTITVHIISSTAGIHLQGVALADIAVTSDTNPFTVAATTFSCGLRLILDPITVDCSCDLPPNEYLDQFRGRRISLDMTSSEDDFTGTNFEEFEVQPMVLPSGLGIFWQDQERYQTMGGPGKDYRYTNNHRGMLRGIDKFSRDASVRTICDESYCQYSLILKNNKLKNGLSQEGVTNRDLTRILIASASSTLRTSFETYLNAFIARGDCGLESVTCATDQDVVDNAYPDVNMTNEK